MSDSYEYSKALNGISPSFYDARAWAAFHETTAARAREQYPVSTPSYSGFSGSDPSPTSYSSPPYTSSGYSSAGHSVPVDEIPPEALIPVVAAGALFWVVTTFPNEVTALAFGSVITAGAIFSDQFRDSKNKQIFAGVSGGAVTITAAIGSHFLPRGSVPEFFVSHSGSFIDVTALGIGAIFYRDSIKSFLKKQWKEAAVSVTALLAACSLAAGAVEGGYDGLVNGQRNVLQSGLKSFNDFNYGMSAVYEWNVTDLRSSRYTSPTATVLNFPRMAVTYPFGAVYGVGGVIGSAIGNGLVAVGHGIHNVYNSFRTQDEIASDGGQIIAQPLTNKNTALRVTTNPVRFFPFETETYYSRDWQTNNLDKSASRKFGYSFEINPNTQILVGPCSASICQAVLVNSGFSINGNSIIDSSGNKLEVSDANDGIKNNNWFGVITTQGLANTKALPSNYRGMKLKFSDNAKGSEAYVYIYDPTVPVQTINLVGSENYGGVPQDVRAVHGEIQYLTDSFDQKLQWIQFYPYQNCVQITDKVIFDYSAEGQREFKPDGSTQTVWRGYTGRQKVFECGAELVKPVAVDDTLTGVEYTLASYRNEAYKKAVQALSITGKYGRTYSYTDKIKFPNGYKFVLTVNTRREVPLHPEDRQLNSPETSSLDAGPTS